MKVILSESKFFSHANTFVGFMLHMLHRNLSQLSEKYTFRNNIGFGRREEGTEHTVKLQLTVRVKNCTQFVNTFHKVFKYHQHCLQTLNKQII